MTWRKNHYILLPKLEFDGITGKDNGLINLIYTTDNRQF
jgi:hypothetical protein